MHTISAGIVDNHIGLEILETLLHGVTHLVGKLLVSCEDSNTDCMLNELSCKVIARVNLLVEGVNDVILQGILVISFMPVTLVRIQINNHEPLHVVPLLHVSCYKRNVWVNAEATA